MRQLTANHLAAQKAPRLNNIVRVVLSKDNQETKTYVGKGGTVAQNRILDLDHTEEPYHQVATLIMDNSDKTLTGLDFKGYRADISWGIRTEAEGDLYSTCAPLWVEDSHFYSAQGKLSWYGYMLGLPDLMEREKANRDYTEEAASVDTIQSLVGQLLNVEDVLTGPGAAFNHCRNIIGNWDSIDDLVNALVPGDSFQFYRGESRLSIIRRLLEPTTVRIRFEWDNGKQIHFFVPPITGPPYSAEYTLTGAPPIHQFYQKYRNTRLVQPNHIDVSSWPDDDTVDTGTVKTQTAAGSTSLPVEGFSGVGTIRVGTTLIVTTAGVSYSYQVTQNTSTAAGQALIPLARLQGVSGTGLFVTALVGDAVQVSYGYCGYAEPVGLLPADRKDAFYELPLASDAQANAVAEAILAGFTIHNPRGSIIVPQHAGHEVYDYIKIDDQRETFYNMSGNVGRLRRHYTPQRSTITLSLGNDNLMAYRNIRDSSFAAEAEAAETRRIARETAYDVEKLSILIEEWETRRVAAELASKLAEAEAAETRRIAMEAPAPWEDGIDES